MTAQHLLRYLVWDISGLKIWLKRRRRNQLGDLVVEGNNCIKANQEEALK